METITADKIESVREREKAAVINVLSEESFRKEHIPGSINIPSDTADFLSKVEASVGGKDRPVIVYCASKECDASPKAAAKLEEAGFKRVLEFEGGMQEWKQTGHEVEGQVAD